MSRQLSQQHLIKGSRSFELVDDEIHVRIDMPFLQKEFTVVLGILDPEPVTKGSMLSFVSAVNREPLVELIIDQPDPESFAEFVGVIRQRVIEEDYGKPRSMTGKNIDSRQLQQTLDMLHRYLETDDIQPYLQSLEALMAAPDDAEAFRHMVDAFAGLGARQGAVLSYAPYIVRLLSED